MVDRVRVTLKNGFVTTAEGRGHIVKADLPPEDGTNTAMNPEELLLAALGSCMSQTAKLYAQRKGWNLEGVDIALEVEKYNAKDYPGYYGDERFVHEIRENIVFHGDLDEDQLIRLKEITTKCPVRRIISLPSFFVEGETLPE